MHMSNKLNNDKRRKRKTDVFGAFVFYHPNTKNVYFTV